MASQAPFALALQPLDNIEEHVGLLAHDEEHAARRKVVEEAEVKIRPVRHKNVAVPQLRGACRCPCGGARGAPHWWSRRGGVTESLV